jgi:hypothetical protein
VTKYFRAKVELRQTVEFEVAAENEASARERAMEIAAKKAPGTRAGHVELTLLGESQLAVGSRIQHALFGAGEITELTRLTNADSEIGFVATVSFGSGDAKKLCLPHAAVKPEAFDA